MWEVLQNQDEVKTGTWQPMNYNATSQKMCTLRDIRIGGTFQWKGEQWRKFEGGVRRQKGRAPTKLLQLPAETKVLRTI